MAKEKNYNPVQAHHKAEKAKAVKKGKAEVQVKRNEKLARRNPDQIQRQIDDLEKVAASGGALSKQEEQTLDGLKNDLRAVKKAREALGDKAPAFSRRDNQRGDGRVSSDGGVLGKRRRDGDDSTEDEDVPEDVRSIPMPRDTPPPVPKDILDRWWTKRRARINAQREATGGSDHAPSSRDQGRSEASSSADIVQARKQSAPAPTPQTVYSSQPVLRDLRKEAAVFMPASVRSKMTETGTSSTAQELGLTDVQGEDKGDYQADHPPRRVQVEDAEDEE